MKHQTEIERAASFADKTDVPVRIRMAYYWRGCRVCSRGLTERVPDSGCIRQRYDRSKRKVV